MFISSKKTTQTLQAQNEDSMETGSWDLDNTGGGGRVGVRVVDNKLSRLS